MPIFLFFDISREASKWFFHIAATFAFPLAHTRGWELFLFPFLIFCQNVLEEWSCRELASASALRFSFHGTTDAISIFYRKHIFLLSFRSSQSSPTWKNLETGFSSDSTKNIHPRLRDIAYMSKFHDLYKNFVFRNMLKDIIKWIFWISVVQLLLI